MRRNYGMTNRSVQEQAIVRQREASDRLHEEQIEKDRIREEKEILEEKETNEEK